MAGRDHRGGDPGPTGDLVAHHPGSDRRSDPRREVPVGGRHVGQLPDPPVSGEQRRPFGRGQHRGGRSGRLLLRAHNRVHPRIGCFRSRQSGGYRRCYARSLIAGQRRGSRLGHGSGQREGVYRSPAPRGRRGPPRIRGAELRRLRRGGAGAGASGRLTAVRGVYKASRGWPRLRIAELLVWCPRSSRATESAEAPDPARRDDEE